MAEPNLPQNSSQISSKSPTEPPPAEVLARLDLPWTTFLKVAAALIIAWSIYQLWSLLLLVFLAMLLAVTLQPFVNRLEARKIPRWASILTIAVLMLVLLGAFFAVIIPSLVTQMSGLADNFPAMREDILKRIPENAFYRPMAQNFLAHPGLSVKAAELPKHLLSVGGLAIGGVAEFALFLVMSLYLLVDGPRAYDWFLAFFTHRTQIKLRKSANEISKVIAAYVAGQLITSVLVLIYAFAVLTLLHVPAALILACLAGIFDILPIIGFFMSTIPAILLAITVSPAVALAVVGLYLAYHALENYFIVPKVYGNRLKLSTLAVLLALLIGGILAGIPGAIAVLPVVASYPIIEKIWLRKYLGTEVVETHVEQQKEAES